MLWINDLQNHKILYTWEFDVVIINPPCLQDLVFLRIINQSIQSHQINTATFEVKH